MTFLTALVHCFRATPRGDPGVSFTVTKEGERCEPCRGEK
jgi:hypothetical protein